MLATKATVLPQNAVNVSPKKQPGKRERERERERERMGEGEKKSVSCSERAGPGNKHFSVGFLLEEAAVDSQKLDSDPH